jgi:hypothetical protein
MDDDPSHAWTPLVSLIQYLIVMFDRLAGPVLLFVTSK